MLSTKRLAATWHGLVPGEVFEASGRSIVVADVQSGSPAESSGFRRGDKLVRVGALPVGSPIDVERGLLDLKPGQQAEVVVMRAGQEQAIPLSVQALPRPTAENDDRIWRLLGVRIQPVTREYVATVSPKFRGGLYVRDVSPGSPADRAMIRQGDILVGMKVGDRDWETIQPDNLLYILSRPEMGRTTSMPLYYVRSNRFVEGVLSLAEPAATASARR
jgi:serine protease Do